MVVLLYVLVYIFYTLRQFHMHLVLIRHVSIKLWLTDMCIIKVLCRNMGESFREIWVMSLSPRFNY